MISATASRRIRAVGSSLGRRANRPTGTYGACGPAGATSQGDRVASGRGSWSTFPGWLNEKRLGVSRLTDLIARAKAKDAALGEELEREFKALASRRAFGLNFERHRPGERRTARAAGSEGRQGPRSAAARVNGQGRPAAMAGRLRVERVRGGRAGESRPDRCRGAETPDVPVEDLVVVAEFRDPIYPGLVCTGKVERGGDKPFHTVINAENFHALEALTLHASREGRRDLHRPALQHRREGLEVQQRLRRERRPLPPLQVARDDGASPAAREGAAEPRGLGSDRDDRREGIPAARVAAWSRRFQRLDDSDGHVP